MGTIHDSAGTRSHNPIATTPGKWYKTVTKPQKERATWKVSTSEERDRSFEDTAVSGDLSGKELRKGIPDLLISCRGSPPAKPYGESGGWGDTDEIHAGQPHGQRVASGPGGANGTSAWQSQDLNMVLDE